MLLTSEVMTNAVVHAGAHRPGDEVKVSLTRTDGLVRVEVTDGHPGVPVAGDGARHNLGGRGTLLLDVLSSAWGVSPTGSGKAVWFELRA